MPWQSARGGRAQVCMYAVVVTEARHRWRRSGRIGTVATRGALMVTIFTVIDGGEEAERRRPGPDLVVAAVFRDPCSRVVCSRADLFFLSSPSTSLSFSR